MSGETILVVDDNHQITDFLAGDLLPELGYETLAAYEGRTALKLIETRRPDLMLLDFHLPDTTGLEMLHRLAEQGWSVPTVLITAEGSEQIAADAFRLGVQDYLIKPVDAEGLNAAVTRALSESRLHREKAKLTAQLKQQVTSLTVLSKVGQSITSVLDVDEVLRRIVEAGVYLTQAEEGFLALLDGQTGQLYLRAVQNIDEANGKNLRLQINDSLLGHTIRTGRPVRMSKPGKSPSLKVSTGFLVQGLLHVPILAKGKVLGVLSVDNRVNVQPFTDMDEMLLSSLADYAAVAIENARLYEQARREIDERARTEAALKTYAAKLERSNHELEQFAYVVSHDLQEPLRKIQALGDLLQIRYDQVLDERGHDFLSRMQNAAARMQTFIEDLLTFSRVTTKPEPFISVDLAQVVDEVVSDLEMQIAQVEGRVEATALPTIEADPTQMRQLWQNLIGNALKFHRPEATPVVKIQATRLNGQAGDHCQITVADNGIGFDEKHLDRIFQVFQRLHKRNEYTGTGIGLAICRKIVERHGGMITARSTPGQGATFIVTLPFTQSPGENGR